MPKKIVKTSATASMSGVATEATRRRLARVFARASMPGPRLSAASGSPISQLNGQASSGPSSATASIHTSAEAGALLVAAAAGQQQDGGSAGHRGQPDEPPDHETGRR